MARSSDRSNRARRPRDTGRPRRLVPRETAAAIDYRDPETLRPFLTERGKIKARRGTGLSRRDQNRLARAVKRARELALLPYVAEPGPPPKRRGRS